jgi:hypothetical protein
LILAPYQWDYLPHTLDSMNQVSAISALLTGAGYTPVAVVNAAEGSRNVTLDAFRSFASFGVVVIETHGGVSDGAVVVDTGVLLDEASYRTCRSDPACKDRDLIFGAILGHPRRYTYSFTPAWIAAHYPSGLERTLVYLSGCSGLANTSLSSVLVGPGSAYFSWKDSVDATAGVLTGIGLFHKLITDSLDAASAHAGIIGTAVANVAAFCGGDTACARTAARCRQNASCRTELGAIAGNFALAGDDGLRLVEATCDPPSADFHEGWERAALGTVVPNGARFIAADEGRWFLGDTVSAFPECGPTPQRAEIIRSGTGKALRLTSVSSESECADNVWVELTEFPGGINRGFSVPLGPDSIISFEESGELVNPEPGWGDRCLVPPCGDAVSLLLIDNRGNILGYVFQRAPDERPNEAISIYREVFLDAGSHRRNLFEDFSAIPDFTSVDARVVSIVFQVSEHGWGILDNLTICRPGT